MTREQVKNIFPDATDEQIDAILNANGADISKAKKGIEKLQEEIERLKPFEAELEQLKNASLTEQEKLQKQLEKAAEAEKNFRKLTNRVTAEKIFVSAGLTEADYSELLESIVSDDAELTTKTANSFVNLLKAQKEATEKAIKEELMRNNPKPPAGTAGGTGEITKEQFDAMNYSERLKLFNEQPEIYKKFTEG